MVALVCLRRSRAVLRKVARYITAQGPLLNNKMGSSFTRSYSPNSGQISSNNENPNASGGTISRMESSNQYVEAVVCNESDLKENEMKVFDIGDEGKVLLVKQKGEFNALGTKCTHYGAPLVNGALGDGRVRCQWHGACFNLKTGDIEDFPGFDSLPCYQVTVTEKGEVKVRAKISDLKTNKRIKDMGYASSTDNSVVVIVGGGPSGATCAETLRSEGFKGQITLVARENYLPYDRIKVSKIGTVTDIEKLQARSQEYYNNASIEVLKGVLATKIEPQENLLHLNNGNKIRYNDLYIATGAKPRVPDVPGIGLKNIFTVRDFEDSINILSVLGDAKDKNVVVLGLSFIGLEIAASCNEKAKSMTIVGKDSAPLGQVFGAEIGRSLQKLFESKGVKFHFGTTVTKCNGNDKGAITSVELVDGTTLPADMLVLGVGTTFHTDFLKDSGIAMEPNGAVTVDERLETNIKHVYAGGDIANAPVAAFGNKRLCIGHVGLAQYHGRVAALNILKKEAKLETVPYFWTMLFGKSIRYAGCGRPASSLVEGDVDALKFVIFFFDEADKVIAVASCMRDPVVSQFAEFLHQGKSLHRKDLKDDPFAWTKTIN